jgi:hypothetical protein
VELYQFQISTPIKSRFSNIFLFVVEINSALELDLKLFNMHAFEIFNPKLNVPIKICFKIDRMYSVERKSIS